MSITWPGGPSSGPDLLFFFQSLIHVLIKLPTSSGGRKRIQVKGCYILSYGARGLGTVSPAETITGEALVDGSDFHLIKHLSIRENNLFSLTFNCCFYTYGLICKH